MRKLFPHKSLAPQKTRKPSFRRPMRLSFQVLEDRSLMAWSGAPPTSVSISSYAPVTLNSLGDASWTAAITANEVDYYRFVANTSGSFQISARTPASSMDTVLGVFNSAGQRLAYNDDIIPSVDRDSLVTINLTANQAYYFGVTNYTGSTGASYQWSVNGPSTPAVTDDAFEQNDSFSAAYNLGTPTGVRTISGLRMADSQDWFRFTMNATGTSADFVRINFTHTQGDLDLVLYNSAGTQLAASTSTANSEQVSLNGRAAGTYYVKVFGYNGAINPNYSLTIDPAVATSTTTDDGYEQNDSFSAAYNLGTLTAFRNVSGLRMADSQDWFRFAMNGTGSSSDFVRINFTHSQGDLDLELYNSAGTRLRVSNGSANGELISLSGLAAGTYYVKIFGYNGVFNPSYSLDIDPPSATVPPPPPPVAGNKVLYLNFDGANISRTDLVRYAGSQWFNGSVNSLDADANGISVQRFLPSRADREQIISQIITMVQTDLNPFGIVVRRHYGLAVENQGATTVFLGQSTLTNNNFHVAGDIDYGNNNRTDIAFVGNEDWGTANNTAIALADVTLHEAGHTFGLHHVNSGTALESMGLRYSTSQSSWLANTSFMNTTFAGYAPHGTTPQNSYAVMAANFGGTGAPAASFAQPQWDNPHLAMEINCRMDQMMADDHHEDHLDLDEHVLSAEDLVASLLSDRGESRALPAVADLPLVAPALHSGASGLSLIQSGPLSGPASLSPLQSSFRTIRPTPELVDAALAMELDADLLM